MKNLINILALFAMLISFTYNTEAQTSVSTQVWNSGTMTTPLIAKARAWDWIEWKQSPTGYNSTAAKGYLNVEAVDANGNTETVVSNLFSNDTTIAGINAEDYPSLRITWYSEDSNSNVAPKLDYIRVLTEASGEFAFRPDLHLTGYNSTVNENETYQFSVMVQNISSSDMDSLLVKYYTAGTTPRYMKVKALAGTETLILPTINIETEGMSGAQNLIVELNPERSQAELSYANNQIIVPFYVEEEEEVEVVASIEATNLSVEQEVYNFPNPVKSFTNFQINLGENYSETETVNINVYDLKGQLVKSMIVNGNNGQGSFTHSWDAADESGNALSAGLYFYNVIAEDNNGLINRINAKSNIQVVR